MVTDVRTGLKAAIAGGLVLLCAAGAFTYAVFSSVRESPLRPANGLGSSGSGDAYITRAADCVACHSVPGGRAFSGGLKMGTPVGNIYSTNITPDKETGIGDYTYEDFER